MASAASSGGGVRQAVRRRLNRTPLRVKLITAVLVLVGGAVAVISVAGMLVFGHYLQDRVDSQLTNQYHEFVIAMNQNGSPGGGPPGGVGPIYVQGPYIQSVRLQGHQLSPTEITGSSRYRIALPDVPLSSAWVKAHAGRLVTVPGLNSPDKWRVITAPVRYYNFSTPQTGTLIIAYDLGDISASVDRLAIIDAIVGGLALVGLAIIGVAVVRASLRPLSDIERTAQQIAAGDLTRRVPETDLRTEVGSLGRSLNTMLAHIEGAFRARTASERAARQSEEAARRSALAASNSEERMRRFVADASHELRTPLTAIRGFAEYYRQRGGVTETAESGSGSVPEPAHPISANGTSPDSAAGPGLPDGPLTHTDLDRIIERVESEAARMGLLVDDMLLLARLDQQRPLDFRTVDLLALAADALHDARLIAPDRTINRTVATSEAPLVSGDEDGLRQVVGNLIGNALTHTPAGTPVDITIRSGSLGGDTGPVPDAPPGPGKGEPAIILEVADQGGGLTGEQKEHVFERFYRADRARSRVAGGTGLGLAIVAAMMSAHHGQVWVDSVPGQGATFGIAVPLAAEARPVPAAPG